MNGPAKTTAIEKWCRLLLVSGFLMVVSAVPVGLVTAFSFEPEWNWVGICAVATTLVVALTGGVLIAVGNSLGKKAISAERKPYVAAIAPANLMTLHKLQIAFSAVCGIVCLMLMALWARSYWKQDRLSGPIPGVDGGVRITCLHGKIAIEGQLSGGKWPVGFQSMPAEMPWYGCRNRYDLKANVQHPRLVAASIAMAVVPWFTRRFSLRALLTATTLAAVIFGIAAVSS